ncbi:hypothetical protein [Geminicoccus roseus]|uniref:hypothetical protein n=1 Tax=Geminicoccus roseus TaxID=404900 RepID=UPI00041B1796|nr:hypothetical protein [Geminicoccus roseus]
MTLPEYRLIGCPIYASTQANIRWQAGHYFSFQAPKSGTVERFLWQTQGARQHSDPTDGHSGGNFGTYLVRFFRCTDWGAPKGAQLAAGVVTPGAQGYQPGRQVNGFDILDPASSPSGVPDSPELQGGLHVQAWMNRVQPLNGVSMYCGTAFVYIDVTADGGPWRVSEGEWILAEFVNIAADPTRNFSFDNNAFSAAAAHPGLSASNAPMDRLLAVRQYLPDTQQPSSDASSGGARGMVPFYMLGYSDGTWYGQPWYYRGRYTSGSPSNGLFDENPTNPNGTAPTSPPAAADRGPALLLFGTRRLRQVLTPPSSFSGETVDVISVHAWRWTSLAGYALNRRLGVRILRVSSTSGRTVTPYTQVWPPPYASGSDVFRLGRGSDSGPFKAFPVDTFVAFGQNVVAGTTLTITPSNLSSRTSPTLTQFEQAIPIIRYGRLAISPRLTLSSSYRYVIELVAESGAAFAMQLQKNPHRYLNLHRTKSDGTVDTSQGRAFMPGGAAQRPEIPIPQVWPCSPRAVPTFSEDNANNSGRFYNAAGKLYSGTSWTEFNDHMLPVCLDPPV